MDTAIIVAAIAAIQALIAYWLKTRLAASIKHEYDTRLASAKHDRILREKAAVIAEFLAEWTHVTENTKRLNQLLWELCLYLPSGLVKDLKATITNAPSHKPAPLLIAEIRDYLLEGQDPISAEDVPHFKHPRNPAMQSIPRT